MEPTDAVFRDASPSDISTLVEFQAALALETEGLQLDRPTVFQGVSAVFENPSLGQYLVALDCRNQLIGTLLLITEWSDWRNGRVLWIHSVYLLPEYRGKGTFSKFYHYVKEKGRAEKDFRGLRLYVDRRNLKAKAVYENLGMSSQHYELYEWMEGSS